jgi:predicted short-subunit dehydrogenase-like oxidoreductase (DUF2520 family)
VKAQTEGLPGSVALLGLGAAGRCLARWLVARGQPCPLLWNRDSAVARDLAAELGGAWVADPRQALGQSELALIAVADSALAGFVAGLEPPAAGPLRAVLHLSGARPPSLLAPLCRRGLALGLFHPLAALPRWPSAEPPAALAIGIRGDAEARVLARGLAQRLGAAVVELAEDDAAQLRYHAAAALAANGLVGLWAEAEGVLAAALTAPGDAPIAVRSLLASSLAALERLGPLEAQTGPIQRGAVDLVGQHLAALRTHPTALVLYLDLSRALLALAGPRLDPQLRQRIQLLLRGPDAGERRGP